MPRAHAYTHHSDNFRLCFSQITVIRSLAILCYIINYLPNDIHTCMIHIRSWSTIPKKTGQLLVANFFCFCLCSRWQVGIRYHCLPGPTRQQNWRWGSQDDPRMPSFFEATAEVIDGFFWCFVDIKPWDGRSHTHTHKYKVLTRFFF